MEFLIPLGLLLAGFSILLFGGDALVSSAVSIASRFNVPPAVIGLTIIAAGTSAPELLTSIMASLQGTPDIALGNIVGSNIFNILVILGAASLLKPNRVTKNLIIFDLPVLALVSAIFLWFLYDGSIGRYEGVFFLALLVVVLFLSVKVANHFHIDAEEEEIEMSSSALKDFFMLTFGIGGLIGGAHLALMGGIQLGQLAGLSERVIGITIISIGTGLPELATSAIAAFRGRDDIAVANIIGSNLMNTLAVGGAAATIKDLPAHAKILNFDAPFMLIATIALIPLILAGKNRLNRTSGALLILVYIIYIGYTI